ncbi:disease resistance protein L6-like, partial [Telopea speciosissima]|uniref:disease resistance protein L6-like n=1 Tax=Telopea speciosissima TaxID=54955 RepID=UPI001CC4FF2D
KHGIHYLQNQLINDIVKQKYLNITDVDAGIEVIRQRFCNKKVLIVLDDVDQDIQAKSLAGDREWFGIGSKIIITSRNKNILIAQKADEIYEPNVMDLNDSLELFSHYAFGRDRPLEDYLDLSETMVKTTGGLPLALQVIGSSLYLKGKSVWEGMLKKLQKVPSNDVMKRLKISYDELDDEEQQMFLDTACFFIGMNKDIACHIWDECGFSSQVGLDALCVRSLVTISEKGELKMHDQLRDLGRQIVHQENKDEPEKRTRIWSQEEVLAVLNTKKGTSNVKGLSIDFRQISRSQCLMCEGFAAMTRLRLLQVDYAQSFGNFTHSFSELRWLSWKGCPDQNVQTNFRPWKLAVLDLSHSKITKSWMGWNYIKMAVNLKVLNLTSCHQLRSTPDISANQLLEVLILKDSINLDEIDTSICCLTKLVILDMSGCYNLESIPNLPSNLKSFDASYCTLLISLPMFSSLKNLEKLSFRGCKKLLHISGLPSSLASLDVGCCSSILDISGLPSSLTSLDVSYCSSIQDISDLPSSLTSLNAESCKSMVKLSSTSGGLRNLMTLCLDYCTSLEEIEGVGDEGLDSLQFFYIKCCPLKKLPKLTASKKLRSLMLHWNDVICDFEGEGMYSLEALEIVSCQSLRKVPNLPESKRLRILEINDCPKLSKIGHLEDYESLQKLSISEVPSLKILPDVSSLKNLSYFRINQCSSMERLPDLSNLKELLLLQIEGLEKLTEIPGLDRLESLRELKIAGCIAIERLPDLSNLKMLDGLDIEGCEILTEIHGIDRLEFLVYLDISGCGSLERLPDLSHLKNLYGLKIEACKNLTEIRGVDRLGFLRKLDIKGCESLERLPDLSNLKKLNDLKIEGWKNLTEIGGIERLQFLRRLDISGCESLERLSDLSNLQELFGLKIEDCKNLTEVHGIDRLEFLEYLDISRCGSLERLPDLSNLKKLYGLKIEACKNLTEIHGVDRLGFLRRLDISGCESLERLPDLSNIQELYSLKIEGCKNLTEIHGVDRLEFLRRSVKITGVV